MSAPETKHGCTDPALGARLTALLGQPAPTTGPLRTHLSTCLACRLERTSFEALETRAVAVPPTVRAAHRMALGRLARETQDPPQ